MLRFGLETKVQASGLDSARIRLEGEPDLGCVLVHNADYFARGDLTWPIRDLRIVVSVNTISPLVTPLKNQGHAVAKRHIRLGGP